MNLVGIFEKYPDEFEQIILNSKREESLETKVPSYIPDRFQRKELVHSMPENQCSQR